jgi:hypothetical protein
MDLALISVWSSIILSGILMGIVGFNDLENNKQTLVMSSLFFLAISFTAAVGIFLMSSLDKIVGFDLGSFGVQYDFNWTREYYLSSRLFYGLKMVALAFAIPFSSWAYPKITPKLTTSKMLSISLIIIGTFTFSFSTLSSLSLGINIGLGLLLSGIVIGYVTSQEFIKKKILSLQLFSTYRFLENNLKEIGEFKQAIYLPKDLTKNSNNTLILKNKNEKKPKSKNSKQKNILLGSDKLVPPGNELSQLLEKKLNTNFENANLEFLAKKLPNIVTEDLEIATNFKIKNHQENIIAEFENSIFNSKEFNKKFSDIIKTFGCPLSSALAIAIATSTDKPTTIADYKTNTQNKTTTVIYKQM